MSILIKRCSGMKDKYVWVRLGPKKWGGWFKFIVVDIAKHANLAQYNHSLCDRQGTSDGLMFEVRRSRMVTKVYVSLLSAIRTR